VSVAPEQSYIPAPPGDFILPFDLPNAGLRGRLVRLDQSSSRAMDAHALPEAAARVAAETCALSALLGSALKLEGRLTVQTKSDGPLDLITADYYSADGDRPAGIRAYARLDEARFAALSSPTFSTLVGSGVVAITIEPNESANNYQGIVALENSGIAKSAEAYFAQSEQLPTAIRLAGAPVYERGQTGPRWRAGGMMLQATPEARVEADDWDRLAAFISTLEDIELVDTSVAAETILWRLFHEDEVRVHPAERIEFRCDCNTSRISSVLGAYSASDRQGLADPDGVIRARCEFCGKTHAIALAAFS
jgi:molecular chaperone Hsp33